MYEAWPGLPARLGCSVSLGLRPPRGPFLGPRLPCHPGAHSPCISLHPLPCIQAIMESHNPGFPFSEALGHGPGLPAMEDGQQGLI